MGQKPESKIAVLCLATALALVACGGDEQTAGGGGTSPAAGGSQQSASGGSTQDQPAGGAAAAAAGGSQQSGKAGNTQNQPAGGASMGQAGNVSMQAGGSSGQQGAAGSGGTTSGLCSGCSGCCDGTTCLPLAAQGQLSCGRDGAKCETCGSGRTCSAGACVVDTTVCSPESCPQGCCAEGVCVLESTWSACSKGGGACVVCEPMAACLGKSACDNDSWANDALIDLYIDGISVSEAQCSDAIGSPDPKIVFGFNGKTYSNSCDDSYSCTFAAPMKIPGVTLAQLEAGVSFVIYDVDETVDDTCWSGKIKASSQRELGKLITMPGDGSVSYHLRPAGY